MCARVAVVTACRLLRLLFEQCGVCYCSPRATQKPWWQPHHRADQSACPRVRRRRHNFVSWPFSSARRTCYVDQSVAAFSSDLPRCRGTIALQDGTRGSHAWLDHRIIVFTSGGGGADASASPGLLVARICWASLAARPPASGTPQGAFLANEGWCPQCHAFSHNFSIASSCLSPRAAPEVPPLTSGARRST